MKINSVEKEKVKSLGLLSEENTAGIAIQIFEYCNDKKDYKKILKVCKKQVRQYFRMVSRAKNHVFNQSQVRISDNLFVDTSIRNFDPKSLNDIDNDHPLEIRFNIHNRNNKGINVSGSSYYGGCNEAEINEFIQILKNGLTDIDFIISDMEDGE